MNINTILENSHFKILNKSDYPNNDITSIRVCDLLSWVMAKGQEGDAWITVQTHANIVAVASLLEIGCIIIPESIKIENDTLIKAEENKIPILSTDLSAYEIFKFFQQSGI